jgi:L-amino acid N-acyltransferase
VKFSFVACTYDLDAPAILAILNESIANSTALYDYEPRSIESMSKWFQTKTDGNFPVIGAVNEYNQLLGFASYGTFRAWPAFKYSIEHSIYIHPDYRRQGIGRALLKRLIDAAIQQQYHVMVGGIDLTNAGSIALHRQLGFNHAGTIRQAGFKFGRWLDLGFYQLLLVTPDCPIDG